MACKIYGPYINDILQQVDAVIPIFAMENELRNLKGRGLFPIPKITPQGIRIDSQQQAKKTLDAVNIELTEILKNIRESEEKYERKRRKPDGENNKKEQTNQCKDKSTTTSAQTSAHQSRTQTPGQGIKIVIQKVSTSTLTP